MPVDLIFDVLADGFVRILAVAFAAWMLVLLAIVCNQREEA